MIIKIGDDIILGGESKFQIEAPLSGLTAPDIRTGDGLYTGMDGGYVSSQFYGFRNIIISGFYIGKTCEEADNLRHELMTKCHIRYLYPVYITTFSGKRYFLEGYITDVKSDIEHWKSGKFQISLHCPDPIIYAGGDGINAQSIWYKQPFYKDSAGGFLFNRTSPKDGYQVTTTKGVQWVDGKVITVIDNFGSVDSYPIFKLEGIFTSTPSSVPPKYITITNITTGEFISIAKTTTSGDLITIDTKNRVITLNHGGVVSSIAPYRTIDSSWVRLVPGENKIVLSSADVGDTDMGTIEYKVGYEGI